MPLGNGDIISVEIKGLDDLQKKLEALPLKIAKKGVRKALAAGSKILRDAMIALVNKDTGFLSEHLGSRYHMDKDEIAGSVFVGPKGRVDYPKFASGAYKIIRNAKGKAKKVGRIAAVTVARFLEFGTSKMSKKPFLIPAFDSTQAQILSAMTQKLKEAVEE